MKPFAWLSLVFALVLGTCLAPSSYALAAEDLFYHPQDFGLDWTAIKFFALGAGLLLLEFFIPGFGVCGIAGIGCILASFYFALGGSRDTLPVLAGGTILLIVVGGLLMKFLPQNPVWKLFALKSSETNEIPKEKAPEIIPLGTKGVALSLLRPSGVASLEGKRVDVMTEGEFIPEGSNIIVVKQEGRKIIVEKEQ